MNFHLVWWLPRKVQNYTVKLLNTVHGATPPSPRQPCILFSLSIDCNSCNPQDKRGNAQHTTFSCAPHKTLTSQLGFPPEFRVTVYVRKWSGNFFHFHYGKGSGNPERFFSRKPEISGTLFRNSGSLRNSGTFRKFPECSGISFRKIGPEIFGTIGTRIKLKPLRLM